MSTPDAAENECYVLGPWMDVLINVLEQNISKQIRGKGSDSEENSGGPITSAPCRETEPEKAGAYDVTPAKHFVL